MKKIQENKMTANAEKKYSLHTMTIRLKLTEDIRETIFESFNQFHSKIPFPKKTVYENNNPCVYYLAMAKFFGFNEVKIFRTTAKNQSLKKYWLDIKINPWKLFHPDEHPYTYIATHEDLTNLFQHIEHMLDTLNLDRDLIHRFYIKRVDFCTNISLGSADAVNEYMNLLRRGSHPYTYQRVLEYSATQKRMIPTINSFTVRSKVLEFSLYDKYKQLHEIDGKYSDDEIANAQGKIRIELRIDRKVIKRQEHKYGLSGAIEFLDLASIIASNEIPRYLKIIYGTGKFVTYKNAKEIIETSNCHEKTKDMLLLMLRLVSGKYTLQLAKETLSEEDDQLYQKCMRKFNDLGISPITIAKRSDIKEFENPIYYIENCCCNSPE